MSTQILIVLFISYIFLYPGPQSSLLVVSMHVPQKVVKLFFSISAKILLNLTKIDMYQAFVKI